MENFVEVLWSIASKLIDLVDWYRFNDLSSERFVIDWFIDRSPALLLPFEQ